MIDITRIENCCGCGACFQTCPVKAINMETDSEGFLYPVIDNSLCVGCGACENVCPIANEHIISVPKKTPYAYGLKIKDEDIRRDSSSGGAFTLIANYVLERGGAVFGCKLDDSMRAVHARIESKEGLHELRGSKYVQSDIGNTYNEVKSILESGRKVLFVGTPCQAAGLYSFLGSKPYDSLLIADFICHGVPSPGIFRDHVRAKEDKAYSRLIDYRFRNKDKGWNQSGLQLGTYSKFENGSEERLYPAFKDKYMNAFLDDVCLRPSCHECHFKQETKTYSDFTLGDFWGLKHSNPDFDDKKGTSLLIINTEKGMKVFNAVKDNCDHFEADFKKAINHNPPLTHSAEKNNRRVRFFSDYEKNGYSFVEKKYMSAFKWAFHKVVGKVIQLFHRFEKLIKFSAVGVSNTAISLAVYYLLLHFGAHYVIAYGAGFLLSVCNAFYWNNKYVFKDKQETSPVKAFVKVLTSYGLSFLLSLGLVSLMVEILGIPSVIAPIIKLIVTIPFNFILNKIWAFKDKKEK